MGLKFNFSFKNIKKQYQIALKCGYKVLKCIDYYMIMKSGKNLPLKTIVNRVDIDFSCEKALKLVKIFNKLKIKASFFVRLHAKEYNPFSFENYKILKFIKDSGHEIGYHSEIIDESIIWNENADKCLFRDIECLNRMLEIKIEGIASHGGMTGLNNLDFWKANIPSDFGLKYEAYDKQPFFNLFYKAFYISDANWTSWKCYDKGKLVEGDRRTFAEHCREGKHDLIYLLIHPDTYYEEHFYE